MCGSSQGPHQAMQCRISWNVVVHKVNLVRSDFDTSRNSIPMSSISEEIQSWNPKLHVEVKFRPLEDAFRIDIRHVPCTVVSGTSCRLLALAWYVKAPRPCQYWERSTNEHDSMSARSLQRKLMPTEQALEAWKRRECSPAFQIEIVSKHNPSQDSSFIPVPSG